MFHAQWLFPSNFSLEQVWEQVHRIEAALKPHEILLASGGYDESPEGRKRTLFVDYNPAVETGEAALIQITEDPELECVALLIRCGIQETFDILLDTVVQHMDRRALDLLAREAIDALPDRKALTRMGLSLVGVRFHRDCYQALVEALDLRDADLTSEVAAMIWELRWRPMLRPLWRAIQEADPESAARQNLQAVFDGLQWHEERVQYLLPQDAELDSVIAALREPLALLTLEWTDNRVDASRWIVSDPEQQIIVAAWEIGGLLAVEVARDWQERFQSTLDALRPESLQDLLAAARSGAADSLLRLVTTHKLYHPDVDELLVARLCHDELSTRLDALMAIGVSSWESALPDLEDRVEQEQDEEARRLISGILHQQRGY